MNTVAKVARAVRLTPETVERVKSLASSLGRSEQTVMESAIEAFLDDAEGGTPDVVEEPVVEATPAPMTNAEMMRARQRQLAREMGWAS